MRVRPQVINGGIYKDNRGQITFVNDLDLLDIKRFYTLEHPETKNIRAWQGHSSETKYFYPIKGSFVVAWVKIDNFDVPSDNLKANFIILDSQNIRVLHIPPGYANGLKALEHQSIVGVFSDMELHKSEKMKYRYSPDRWIDWSQDFKDQKIKEYDFD